MGSVAAPQAFCSKTADKMLEGKQPCDTAKLYGKDAETAERLVTVLVVGAGNRGTVYSNFALDFPDRMKVVGVADPRPSKREIMRKKHELEESHIFKDWKDAASCERFADAVVIATPDKVHRDPAVAFAAKGYHILLEKPMAVTEADCQDIADACREHKVMLAVGHVLRYTPVNKRIKELIDSGVIGDVVNVQHTEPIGHFHFAHSYVRGNWRRTDESTFSLMAKSCHDLDLIRFWMQGPAGKPNPLKSVSSVGSLFHFQKANKPKPAGAATRCLDCLHEAKCAYSAKKIYLDPLVHEVRALLSPGKRSSYHRL